MYGQMTFDEYLKQRALEEATISKKCQMQQSSEQLTQTHQKQYPTSASSKP